MRTEVNKLKRATTIIKCREKTETDNKGYNK